MAERIEGNKIILTSAVGVNKSNDKIEKSGDGYYKLAIGALNVCNIHGQLYVGTEKVLSLFKGDSSKMCNLLNRGMLKGEYGHPRQPNPPLSNNAWLNRNLAIVETATCIHWREIILEDTGQKGENGSAIYNIWGWGKPSGPYGPALEEDINNPNVNVSFSIRSLIKEVAVGGRIHRHIFELMTFDYVNEPGIHTASKYVIGKEAAHSDEDTMVLDYDTVIDIDEIKNSNGQLRDCVQCGLEDANDVKIYERIIAETVTAKTAVDITSTW